MKYKAVFLDRDGVINADSDEYIRNVSEWHPLPGVFEAIAALKNAGVIVCVCSNQSGVGRGYFDLNALHEMHMEFQLQLAQKGAAVDRIYFCPHHPDDGCICRKPSPGMLKQAQAEFALLPHEVLFIGDSRSDYECAYKFGCDFALVLTGKGANSRDKVPASVPVHADLPTLVSSLLGA